ADRRDRPALVRGRAYHGRRRPSLAQVFGTSRPSPFRDLALVLRRTPFAHIQIEQRLPGELAGLHHAQQLLVADAGRLAASWGLLLPGLRGLRAAPPGRTALGVARNALLEAE